MTIDVRATLSTIETLLMGVTVGGSQLFAKVYTGEVWGLPPEPRKAQAQFFLTGRGPSALNGAQTLSQSMNGYTVRVEAFWAAKPGEYVAALEEEIWNAAIELQSAFRADSQLGGNVSDLKVGDVQVQFEQMTRDPVPLWRVLRFDVDLEELEGEAITA